MSPAAVEATRQHNAMQQALARAQARPKKITPAPAPKTVPPPTAPRYDMGVAPTVSKQPVTPESLSLQIAGMVTAGTVDLTKPATVLADALRTDITLLSAAMVALGYVRTRRGISGELYFTKPNAR